jgi:hypothetical protein
MAEIGFTTKPIWFTLGKPFYDVVGIRQPIEGHKTKKMLFMDRGRVEVQKYGAKNNMFRIICIARHSGEKLVTIPIESIKEGEGKWITNKKKTMGKGACILRLSKPVNTNFDELEQFTLKLEREEANRLADLLIPSWKIGIGII